MSESVNLRNVLLIVLTAVLLFAGPTYVIFILVDILRVNYFVSLVFGFGLFLIGLALLFRLLRDRVIP
ncbi:MAG: hypothetical protein QXT06_04440 [Candidatus Bathyarchaeia archaeon]|nr:hypothetical protein [Candidatus Bathyarchaeota archaeon]